MSRQSLPEEGVNVEAESERLPCPSCSETFARSEHLERHLRKHTGEKPFVCSWCERRFARSDSKKRHELLHVGSRQRKSRSYHSQQEKSSSSRNDPQSQHSASDAMSSHGSGSVTYGGVTGRGEPATESYTHPSPFNFQNRQNTSASQGLDPAMPEIDNFVMSDINWLPLIPPAYDEGNPFSSLWDEALPNFGLQAPVMASHSSYANNSYQQPMEISTGDSMSPLARSQHREYTTFTSNMTILDSPGTAIESVGSAESRPLDDSARALHAETSPQGEQYVDGGVTRLAKGRKRTLSISSNPRHISNGSTEETFSLAGDASALEYEDTQMRYVSERMYGTISGYFHKTCSLQQRTFPPYESEQFPSLQSVERLVTLCVEHFLPSIPCVNKALLLRKDRLWLLYLSLATIGARYAPNISESQVDGFTEFLRRSHVILGEERLIFGESLELVQSKLLSCVVFTYSASSRYHASGKKLLLELSSFCTSGWRSHITPLSEEPSRDLYIMQESVHRTVYAILLFDHILAYQTVHKPILDLEDVQAPLPTSETQWNAIDHSVLTTRTRESIPLLQACEKLYIEKKVDVAIGEFSHILLVHALVHQTNSVAKHCRSKLSMWEPQAQPQAIEVQDNSASENWLPANETYSKWRNAACDCLDVLHWHANAVIGLSSGNEHSTILFLHLCRVLILSPIHHIRKLVEIITGEAAPTKETLERSSKEVTKWAYEDCYKARLAIIHAGVLLYHVRRHSLDSFYEPCAVFLSIICLWAYASAYAGAENGPLDLDNPQADAEGELLPTLIHLDRPCDDELVQLFITNGNRIVPNVTGVGNICSPSAASKILQVGCNVLRHAGNWDLKRYYTSILMRLQQHTSSSG